MTAWQFKAFTLAVSFTLAAHSP